MLAVRWLSLLLAAVSAAAVCGCFPELRAKRPRPVVRFSVLPRYSPHTMSRGYGPLARYLSESTGYDVRYVGTLNYETYARTVEWSRVDVGFHNPLIEVALEKSRGARPLLMALAPNGEPLYRGLVVARRGAGITSVAQLRGKQIIAVASKTALAGYLSQQALCEEAGVDIDRDCLVILVRNQEQVLSRVALGRADAGFLAESVWQDEQNKTELRDKLRVIAYTDYLPGWCVAAFPDANDEAVKAIKEALLALKLPQDRDLLGGMDTSGFIEATDADYAPVRSLAAALQIPL